MKVQLETFQLQGNRNFRVLINPILNDVFYWHHHEEYELVYIKGIDGKRVVGSHISPFRSSDLVMVGSNIPHLNFDYGAKGDYELIVVHLRKEMVTNLTTNFPELDSLQGLFRNSMHGIVFSGAVKEAVGHEMLKLSEEPAYSQFIIILKILKLLAESEYELLHKEVYQSQIRNKAQGRLTEIYDFVHANFQRKINLEELSDLCALSRSAFCRYFKRQTGITFFTFLNQYRISQAKKLLLMGRNVSEACFESGFESLSYFNRRFKSLTGINPSEYKS